METKKVVFSNLIWRFMERTGAQLVSFVVSIVLARILLPEEYGIIALATVVIMFLNVFIDSGLGNALIQKKQCDDTDYSTAFWANIFICVILYAILFTVVAPIMASIYENDLLKSVVRVMGISVLASSVKNVQQAYVSRQLQFKKFFVATSIGTIISAIVGIYMAYAGFGVWALVAQYLANTCIDTIVLCFVIDLRIHCIFSFARLKQLFSYGYKLLLSSLINCTYDNLRQLIVGKVYSSSDLAFYNRGKQFPSLIVTNINSSIDSVLFPVLSKEQDSKDNLVNMVKRSLTTSSFLLFPVLFGLAAISEHMVPLVLTEKWNNSIIFIQIFCLFYSFYPMQTTNLNLIKAVGKSEIFLKLEIIQTVVGIILLFPVISKGPVWIAFMYLVASVFNSLLIGYEAGRQIDYGMFRQCLDILPYYAMSAIMAFSTYMVGKISENHWIVIIQVAVGMLIYVLMGFVFRPSAFNYVLAMITGKKKNQ